MLKMHVIKTTVDSCLFKYSIPVELRHIVVSFVPQPLDNKELRAALKLRKRDPAAAILKYGHMSGWNTREVTDMTNLFNKYPQRDIPNLNHWDVHNVTSMNSTFQRCHNFNQPLDKWDVSNVTNMLGMFSECHKFNQPLQTWNTCNVTTMEEMFYEAYNFNQPIGTWNTCNVISMAYTFFSTRCFNQPLDNWMTCNVLSMESMFHAARSFNQSICDWDVSTVFNMECMFYEARSFNQSFHGKWQLHNDCDTFHMFQGCKAFRQPNDSVVPKVQFTNESLRIAVKRLTRFDRTAVIIYGAIRTWDVSQISDMSELFQHDHCINHAINDWDVSNVTTMNRMFYGNYVFNQPLNKWNVSKVIDMTEIFACTIRFNQPLDAWDICNVSHFKDTFRDAQQFHQPETIVSWRLDAYETSLMKRENQLIMRIHSFCILIECILCIIILGQLMIDLKYISKDIVVNSI